jgi:hypothetical protein
LKNDRIKLKHDHRHEDGTEDKVTQWRKSPNSVKQYSIFSSRSRNIKFNSNAATNVWWITIDETSFTYNLRRMDLKDCLPKFDLTKTVATPTAPCWDGKTRTL